LARKNVASLLSGVSVPLNKRELPPKNTAKTAPVRSSKTE